MEPHCYAAGEGVNRQPTSFCISGSCKLSISQESSHDFPLLPFNYLLLTVTLDSGVSHNDRLRQAVNMRELCSRQSRNSSHHPYEPIFRKRPTFAHLFTDAAISMASLALGHFRLIILSQRPSRGRSRILSVGFMKASHHEVLRVSSCSRIRNSLLSSGMFVCSPRHQIHAPNVRQPTEDVHRCASCA